MRKLLAAVTAAVSFCVTGSLSAAGGLAAADEPAPDGPVTAAAEHSGTPGRGYALGGAHVLGIPYDEYIRRTGADWFPGLDRQIVDYPAGQVQGHTLERLFPGIGQLDESAVFYLRSRGLDKDQARALLQHAFVMEALETVPLEAVRDRMEENIVQKLMRV